MFTFVNKEKTEEEVFPRITYMSYRVIVNLISNAAREWRVRKLNTKHTEAVPLYILILSTYYYFHHTQFPIPSEEGENGS